MAHSRLIATVALALVAVGVIVGSAVWAYSTFDYWETAPILATVPTAAVLLGGAYYVATRQVGGSLAVAFLALLMNFALVAVITGQRWGG